MRNITFLRRDGQGRGVDGEVREGILRYSLYHGLMVVRVVSIGIYLHAMKAMYLCFTLLLDTATHNVCHEVFPALYSSDLPP